MPAQYTKLFESHKGFVSDKWSLYLEKYEEIFKPYRSRRINLLEIGVQNGGSLEIWSKYFSDAKNIIGCDIDQACSLLDFNTKKIKVIMGDATNKSTINVISDVCQKFNIIIDDGSHQSADIIKSFINCFEILSDEGIYVVEDLHCSYWKEYEGGLYHPYSSIAFFKALADVINFEHWGIVAKPTTTLDNILRKYNCESPECSFSNLHSIEFTNSMCVIKKRQKNGNKLGKRRVSGENEDVQKCRSDLHGSFMRPPNQSNNKWNISLEAQLAKLQGDICQDKAKIAELQEKVNRCNDKVTEFHEEISQRDKVIAELEGGITQRDMCIEKFKNSTSWKITRPVRSFAKVYVLSNKIKRSIKILFKSLKYDGVLITYIRLKKRFRNIPRGYSFTDSIPKKINKNVINNGPLISVIVPVFNTPASYLKECINSVINQVYKNWELLLIDDGSTDPYVWRIISRFASRHDRVKAYKNLENENISKSINTGLKYVKGTYFFVLDHDDTLALSALYWLAEVVLKNPDAEYVYSDEDKLDKSGKKYLHPSYKPDWSPEYFLQCMYSCHISMFRTKTVKSLGGYRSEFDGTQDYDMALRVIAKTKAIYHVPKVLYHWRMWEGSTASGLEAKPYAYKLQRKALKEFLNSQGDKFEISDHIYRGQHKVVFLPKKRQKISIVIPTANASINIEGRCENHADEVIKSIITTSSYENYEIILVHNGDLTDDQINRFQSVNILKLVQYEKEEFSLSEKINIGCQSAVGEYFLILNDDIRVITRNWMERMLGMLQRDNNIGAVGAKLLFPDNSIQHVGVTITNGLPKHPYYRHPCSIPGYDFCNQSQRNCISVTGACQLTPKSLFNKFDGYSLQFPLNYNDVDYCLRLHAAGYRSVCLTDVELYHYEGVSKVGGQGFVRKEEEKKFIDIWAKELSIDPYYNPNLNQSYLYEI